MNVSIWVRLVVTVCVCSVLSGCPKCPEGQTREVTSYFAWETPESIAVPAGATVCRITGGMNEWQQVQLTSTGVSYETTFLSEPVVDDAGRKTYYTRTRSLDDWGATAFDLWLDCASGAKLETEILVRYPDLTRATLTTRGRTEVPFASGEREYLTAFAPVREKARTQPFGVCITNTSGAAVSAQLQYYFPQLACVTQKPTPTRPSPAITCQKPPPPHPPATPPPPRTCSGQVHNGNVWAVPASDPRTGCADVLSVAANSLDEAQGCIRAAGYGTPTQVCKFEVLLYSNAASVYVYPAAEDERSAEVCAQVTQCSSCSPSVTAKGDCYIPFRYSR